MNSHSTLAEKNPTTPATFAFCFLACDIEGHATSTLGTQIARIEIINGVISRALRQPLSTDRHWFSAGDGGHLALEAPCCGLLPLMVAADLLDAAIASATPLRICVHHGRVGRLTYADGTVQLVGDGINFSGKAIKHAGSGRITVSAPFRRFALEHGESANRFQNDQSLQLTPFGDQQLFRFDDAGYPRLRCPTGAEDLRSTL